MAVTKSDPVKEIFTSQLSTPFSVNGSCANNQQDSTNGEPSGGDYLERSRGWG